MNKRLVAPLAEAMVVVGGVSDPGSASDECAIFWIIESTYGLNFAVRAPAHNLIGPYAGIRWVFFCVNTCIIAEPNSAGLDATSRP